MRTPAPRSKRGAFVCAFVCAMAIIIITSSQAAACRLRSDLAGPRIASRLGVQRQQVESLPSRRREILPFRQGRSIVAVTAGAPLRGAVGKCDISSAPIRSRHSIWRATGHIGVGLEQRELELLSFGRTTSEKSWVGKTANQLLTRSPCKSPSKTGRR